MGLFLMEKAEAFWSCVSAQGLVNVCLNGPCEAGTKALWFEIDLIQYDVLVLITPIAHFILTVF